MIFCIPISLSFPLVSTDGITLPERIGNRLCRDGIRCRRRAHARRILADAFASSCLTLYGFAHTIGLIIPVIAIFCVKKIQIERSSYESSLDCVKCCVRRRDPGGAARAASGGRKGLETATHARWQARLAGDMVQ